MRRKKRKRSRRPRASPHPRPLRNPSPSRRSQEDHSGLGSARSRPKWVGWGHDRGDDDGKRGRRDGCCGWEGRCGVACGPKGLEGEKGSLSVLKWHNVQYTLTCRRVVPERWREEKAEAVDCE